jgi:hypothetical protein
MDQPPVTLPPAGSSPLNQNLLLHFQRGAKHSCFERATWRKGTEKDIRMAAICARVVGVMGMHHFPRRRHQFTMSELQTNLVRLTC